MNNTLVIAEAGPNHNQDWNLAKKLVDVAIDSGADVVKFQTYSSNTLYAKQQKDVSGIEDIHSMFKSLEIPRHWQKDLKMYCDDNGIEFMSTPFDEKAVDELYDLGVKRLKISGFEGTDPRFVDLVASTGLDIIMSAGIGWQPNYWGLFADIFEKYNNEVTLLHCVNAYPTPIDQINLSLIDKGKGLRKVSHIGLSDHTQSTLTPALAVARGATVIEKHFTISNLLPGPDHYFSIEPQQLKEMVHNIRQAELAMSINDSIEELKHTNGRRSIVAKVDLKKGDVLTKDNITTKRPYYPESAPAIDYFSLLGTTIESDIKTDVIINKKDLSSFYESQSV